MSATHRAPRPATQDTFDGIDEARTRLGAQARESMGFSRETSSEPFGALLREGGGWYPLVALGVLGVVDQFQGYAFFVLAPEISRALGISRAGLAGLTALEGLAGTLATLVVATVVQKRPRRGIVSIIAGFGWSLATLFTGFVRSGWGLGAVLVGDGVTSASVSAVHTPLLVDTYPPAARVRVLAVYRAINAAGNVASPALVGLLSAVVGLTWRGVFVTMGVASVFGALFSIRLRDPGFGRMDASRARAAIRPHRSKDEVMGERASLGFFEIVRRLLLIPTIQRLLVANSVLGMLLVPLYTYTFFFLDERWGMGPGARGLFFAVMPLFSITALWAFGRRAESMFHRDPAILVRLGAVFLGAGVVVLALALFVPVFGLMVLLYGTAIALFSALGPALNATILSIVPPAMRPHAAALSGVFMAGVGGFGGLILLGGIDRRFGVEGAIASLAGPGIIAAVVFATAGRTVNSDIDRMVEEMVEEEQQKELRASRADLPLLSCRHVDFSYGHDQVLFDVSVVVGEGEMVALLGTNGAGKSTLLGVVSGTRLPTGGSVRYQGADITYMDTARRLTMGINHVSGQASVFPTLSVVENLRLFAYSLGRNRRLVEAGTEAALEAFPCLENRRDQRASTLSGGERQMLGLAKALVVPPRLLVVDELFLGLSPKVVREMVDVVRSINEAGAGVLIVEQSVRLALSVAHHAYFLERGRIRFDGPGSVLAERMDLLRPVFLPGGSGTPTEAE